MEATWGRCITFFFLYPPIKGQDRVLDNIKFRDIKKGKLQPRKKIIYIYSQDPHDLDIIRPLKDFHLFFFTFFFLMKQEWNYHEFILNSDCQNSAAGSDVAAADVGPIPIPAFGTAPPSDTLPTPPPPPPPDESEPGAGPGWEPDPGAEPDPEAGAEAEVAEAAMEGVKEDTVDIEHEEGLTKGNAWRRRRSRSVRDAMYFVGSVVYRSMEGWEGKGYKRRRRRLITRYKGNKKWLSKRETTYY